MPQALAEPWNPEEPDVMEITGRLDEDTATHIEEDIRLCIQSGARRMVLDCRELSYMSGAGLRAILSVARAMQKAGGHLAVCSLQAQVNDMFTVSGCDTVIPVFNDRNEVFTAFAA
jgi:anti-anti-sigma factor